MSASQSGNRTHDATVSVAESIRQGACTPTATKATVVAAEVTFYRSCIASAVANGVNAEQYHVAIYELTKGA